MKYDLDLIHDLCGEVGLAATLRAPDHLAIALEDGVVLCFQNEPDHCLASFEDTPWHVHCDFLFSDRHGFNAKLNALDVVTGFVDGTVLICEFRRDDPLADRSLVHCDFVDEFHHLRAGDEVVIRRLWIRPISPA